MSVEAMVMQAEVIPGTYMPWEEKAFVVEKAVVWAVF